MAYDNGKHHLNVWEIWWWLPVTKSWLTWAILLGKTNMEAALSSWNPFNDINVDEIVSEFQEQIEVSWNKADIETLREFIAENKIAV